MRCGGPDDCGGAEFTGSAASSASGPFPLGGAFGCSTFGFGATGTGAADEDGSGGIWDGDNIGWPVFERIRAAHDSGALLDGAAAGIGSFTSSSGGVSSFTFNDSVPVTTSSTKF